MTFPTFGIWRRKPVEVLDYKVSMLDGFECSTDEFYRSIEEELRVRKVPGLEVAREFFSEGGVLSAKREYLRLRRERLAFDICSAPFGEMWFFSYRFFEIPCCLMVWELLIVLAALAGICLAYVVIFGALGGSLIFGASLFGMLVILRYSVALGLRDWDAWLLKVPVLGAVYEALIRKETYYREDTRVMYLKLIGKIVEANVESFTAAKGVTFTGFQDNTPNFQNKLQALLKEHS